MDDHVNLDALAELLEYRASLLKFLWLYGNYEIICCHLQEEIDIEAKVLRAGKAVGVATVELKKKSGKIIAQARYSKYLGASSKLWRCPCIVSCKPVIALV